MPAPVRLISSLLALSLSPVFAQSPSFDCTKASSPREQTICSNLRLRAADAQLATAYKLQLARLSPAAATLVRGDQREWLHWLDRDCPVIRKPETFSLTDCLQSAYESRLSDLREIPHPAGAPALYTRAHFVLVPSKDEDPVAPNDPGFGTGTFAWLQMDNPTPPQAVWNQAVLAAAIKTTQDKDANPSPNTFDTAVDPQGTIEISVQAVAANSRLITADIVNSTYGYGAAHPNTFDTYFSWWLDSGRELTSADVFRPGSDWQSKLVALVFARLSAHGPFSDPAKIKESIAQELQNTTAWEITRTGFTLHFGQYEIGPYAIGMPSATIPWADLKSFLAPSLNLEILPAPISANRR